MVTSILQPEIQSVLDRLHTLADDRDEAIIQQFLDRGHDWQSSTSEQKAVGLGLALLPISKDVGKFLYGVARSISAKHIVEFAIRFGYFS